MRRNQVADQTELHDRPHRDRRPILRCPGASAQFTATGRQADGATRDVTSEVNWASSNRDILAASNVEALSPSDFLIVSGSVTATELGSGFAGTLDGAMTVYSGALSYFPKIDMECKSGGHRITFRR
jgi:hypothetical protein